MICKGKFFEIDKSLNLMFLLFFYFLEHFLARVNSVLDRRNVIDEGSDSFQTDSLSFDFPDAHSEKEKIVGELISVLDEQS